jgi:hypothetical protein
MKWTKRHSQNAVAARVRKRLDEPLPERWSAGRLRLPRRSRARFTLQIRDHAVGDSLTLNLHPAPWPNRWLCEQGEFSTARLARAVALILQGGV